MKTKSQIFIVHGGMTFKSKKDYLKFLRTRPVSTKKRVGWNWTGDYLDSNLGKSYQIIRPRMPLQDNAVYSEWKIHFERFIPSFRNNVILIGASLGGIFLAKYLSEQKFPKKIAAVFLICAPFDGDLPSEDLAGGFKLKADLSLLQKNTKNLWLMFSADDDVVPVSHAEKYRKKLPAANIVVYKGKNGHFNISKFPEIIKIIKSLQS